MIVPFFGSIISVHFSNSCSVHFFLQAKWSTLSLFFGTKTLNRTDLVPGFWIKISFLPKVTCPVKPCLMISEVPWGTGPSSYSSLISGSYASITQLFLDDSSVLKNTDWRLQLRPPATNLKKYFNSVHRLDSSQTQASTDTWQAEGRPHLAILRKTYLVCSELR